MSASTSQQQFQVIIPIAEPKPQSSPPLPQPNLPRADLLVGGRENYFYIGVPLYEASIKGDWEVVATILHEQPHLIRSAITENYETPLHVAASTKSTKQTKEFVKNLVNLMEPKDLELQNKNYHTALSLAAATGNVKMVDIMVNKNRALLEIAGPQGMMPLYIAALFGKHDMVRYLYDHSTKMTGNFWTDHNRGWVLQKCVEADLFVFAVLHLKIGPSEKESEALLLLRIVWKSIAIMPKNDINDIMRGSPISARDGKLKYPSRALFIAAKSGNARFIIEIIRSYPDLAREVNDQGLSIFHVAVKRRQEKVYNLINQIGSIKDMITPLKDESGNNMLHLVGKSTKIRRKPNMPGVALQMQRELLWYKEVEQMIPPSYRERKNENGETPYELFTKKHGDQQEQAEQWMKETASQCMVGSALIATIVFAAAFTLPGGYNQDTGYPSFHKRAFMVFVISDAISLVFSSTSVLIFVSILTSVYVDNDFMESSPKKLMFGLATLLLSVITMMLSFSASFFVLYNKNLNWVPIIVTGFASLPVILFSILQFRFLVTLYYLTYRSTSLFQTKNHTLYY